ncbi:NINE protein [Lactococcus muris]|uniref:NINE protein n=1 Tax=Lactococcus muris TaxID=2941330 RepID=A0ABV4D9S3_9LACT|nr:MULTISPECIES: NINE protein [Lactococcus]
MKEIGVDRFMRGQIGMSIFKRLCNWMTFGIWSLID